MITNYNPNIRWGKQHVEIVLMQWDYKKSFTVDIGGNCIGFDVIEAAVERIYDGLPSDELGPFVILTNSAGDDLECQDEEGREDEWIKDMVVSAQIVGWTSPTVNEVREMNGAKPLPDGDRPWQP
jgi:hypothetical protein